MATPTPPTTTTTKQILFPLPPRYFRLYTEENVQLHQERTRLEAEGLSCEHAGPELSFLPNLDPPPPLRGDYTMFGHRLTTEHSEPSLAAAGIEQLYPEGEFDHPAEIKKLTLRLLQAILKLLDHLTARAEPAATPTAHLAPLTTLFLNLLHLVNAYRPHQAMETLALSMEKQVFDVSTALAEMSSTVDHIQTNLQALTERPLFSKIPEISPVLTTQHCVAPISAREQIWQQMLALK